MLRGRRGTGVHSEESPDMAFNKLLPTGTSELFVTPLARRLCPGAAAVNARLREIVLERERTEPAVNLSKVGGWQSERTLLDWPHPEMATLRGWIAAAARELTVHAYGGKVQRIDGKMRIQAWANVSRRGDFHRVHNHPGATWSGVYYVAPGDAPKSEADGLIEFVDPRGGANMVATSTQPFGQSVRLRPRAGELILFPGWLQHYVNPYQGDEPRISIGFNVETQDLSVVKQKATAKLRG